jgi:hypothetical protein
LLHRVVDALLAIFAGTQRRAAGESLLRLARRDLLQVLSSVTGQMCWRLARCSTTWPPPSKYAGETTNQRRTRKRCRPLIADVTPPAGRQGCTSRTASSRCRRDRDGRWLSAVKHREIRDVP